MSSLTDRVRTYLRARRALIADLRALLAALDETPAPRRSRLSVAGRARIGSAARKRWAAYRKAKSA